MHLATAQARDTAETPSLDALFEEHHQAVFRAAFRVTGSSEDAEDVLQAVFLKLAGRRLPPGLLESPGRYLHRTAVNAAIDLVRTRRPERSVPLDGTKAERVHDRKPRPDEESLARETKSRVRRALGQLSARSAEIFVLRYFEGYGNKEIARMVGTSESAVAVILHRARHRVRDELTGTTRNES
jgi:RNA polymerase sigma-70 factor (ECF subfamily)